MARPTYIEQQCKSALNRVTGMPFAWSLNPYRGCVHACHYCYARATHAYFGLNADEDFETKVFVKVNLPELLRRELAKPSWTGERVSIGTATDSYQPCEGRYRITRRALEAMRDFRNPLSVVTKSTLVLRDGDVLADLAQYADVSVHFTITTLDPEVWRAVEPGTAPPWKRLEVMRRLVDRGVRCGVFIAPVLPGITDSVESLEAVISGAKDHGATHVWASPLRLAPLVKEHYFNFVDEVYPLLLQRYERAYSGTNAPQAYQDAIQERVDRILTQYGYDEMNRGKQSEPRVRLVPVGRDAPEQLALGL